MISFINIAYIAQAHREDAPAELTDVILDYEGVHFFPLKISVMNLMYIIASRRVSIRDNLFS